MLEKAVVAVKADKAKALAMFNTGEGRGSARPSTVGRAPAINEIVTAKPKSRPKGSKETKAGYARA